MRLMTSLIVASVAGSALMGGLKSYLGTVETIPARAVLDLYHKDEAATRRLIHQATFLCVPELDTLRTPTARSLVPHIFAFTMVTAESGNGELSDQQKDHLLKKEVIPALNQVSAEEAAQLSKVMKQIREQGPKMAGCVMRAVMKLSSERQANSATTFL